MYVLTTSYLLICSLLERRARNFLSVIIILFFVSFRGEVGGDYYDYVERGLYSINNPQYFLHEPFTLIFAHISNATGVPLPNLYTILIIIVLFFGLGKTSNPLFWPIVFLIFIAPVSIGYLRQALAVAFLIYYFRQEKSKVRYMWAFMSILSHPSSILVIVISEVIDRLDFRSIHRLILLLPIFSILFYYGGYLDSINHYITHYGTRGGFNSSGYIFRFLLYISIFIILLKYIDIKIRLKLIAMIGLPFLIFILFSVSTATDRIQIYCLPLLMISLNKSRLFESVFILYMSIIYFFSWFFLSNFAQHHWKYEFIFGIEIIGKLWV
ncbi:EpsG family protein [Vibrio nigripulchritudo]